MTNTSKKDRIVRILSSEDVKWEEVPRPKEKLIGIPVEELEWEEVPRPKEKPHIVHVIKPLSEEKSCFEIIK